MTNQGLCRKVKSKKADLCHPWQYGNCQKSNCPKLHKCEDCQANGKQHFGKNKDKDKDKDKGQGKDEDEDKGEERDKYEDKQCRWCYVKTCITECIAQILATIFFIVNIGSKLYTGIFYLVIGEF